MTICSLFLHHRNDPVTVDHYERLKRFSSGRTVAFSSDATIESGESIATLQHSLWREQVSRHPKLKAKSTDLLLIDWFRNRSVSADRYFIVEWDTLVNQSITAWLANVIDYPFAAPSIRLPTREPEWFRRFRKFLPVDVRPLATGIVPFSCVMVSHEALQRIEPLYTNDLQGLERLTGECRFATLAAHCGIGPVSIPNSRTITWKPSMPIGLAPTIYHPIKRLFTAPEPWMQPEEIASLELLLDPMMHVLEFGSGRSTFWLAHRVAKVTTIEHDSRWLERAKPFPPNVEVRFEPPAWPNRNFEPAQPGQFNAYIQSADDLTPDLVLVDGRARVPISQRWATRTLTVLHDANRPRYSELRKKILAGSLARILPLESANETE